MPSELIHTSSLTAALLSSFLSAGVLVGCLTWLYRRFSAGGTGPGASSPSRRDAFAMWLVAWLFYGLWLVLKILVAPPSSTGLVFSLEQCMVGSAAVFLLGGALRLLQSPMSSKRTLVLLASVYSWACAGESILENVLWAQAPVFLLMGAASAMAGLAWARQREVHARGAAKLLAPAFLLWSFCLLVYPFTETRGWLQSADLFLSAALQMLIGWGLTMWSSEQAPASTEQVPCETTGEQEALESVRQQLLLAQAEIRELRAQASAATAGEAAALQWPQDQHAIVQEERLQALGHMASGIAHDINNSLTPIIGYSDFLLMADMGIPEESRKHLQCIRTAAGDIARMVEHVRQFYRRRVHGEPLQPIDLNRLTQQVIENLQPGWHDLTQRQGTVLNVLTEFDRQLPPVLESAGDVREALVHLVKNAIEAMPQGGTLTVRTGRWDSNPRGDSDTVSSHVVWEVSDTGIGMDDLTRQRCLEPFFSTKGARGRGLGLAMVYGLIRRHGGSIEIHTQVQQGTTVRLLFQAAPAPVAVTEEAFAFANAGSFEKSSTHEVPPDREAATRLCPSAL